MSVVRHHAADKMAGAMVAAYIGVPVIALVAPEGATVGTASAVAREIIVKTIIASGAAATIGTLIAPTPAKPDEDDDDGSLNVGLGLAQHLQPWARNNEFTTYVDVYGTVFQEDAFAQLMNNADTINFNMEGFNEERFQNWVKEGAVLSQVRGSSTVTNYEMHQVLTNPNWRNKLIPHNGSLPKLPK